MSFSRSSLVTDRNWMNASQQGCHLFTLLGSLSVRDYSIWKSSVCSDQITGSSAAKLSRLLLVIRIELVSIVSQGYFILDYQSLLISSILVQDSAALGYLTLRDLEAWVDGEKKSLALAWDAVWLASILWNQPLQSRSRWSLSIRLFECSVVEVCEIAPVKKVALGFYSDLQHSGSCCAFDLCSAILAWMSSLWGALDFYVRSAVVTSTNTAISFAFLGTEAYENYFWSICRGPIAMSCCFDYLI